MPDTIVRHRASVSEQSPPHQRERESRRRQQVEQSLESFIGWLHDAGYSSHDPYDLWSTRYGIGAKALYQRNKYLGLPFIAPILLADIFFPSLPRLLMPKHRFPIADAHCILAFCNLYERDDNVEHLHEAEEIAQALEEQSLGANYHGHCWGYPFDWQTNQGLWKSSTPIITTTPYCFEAYLRLYDLTHRQHYADLAQSIAQFALRDLNETIIDEYSSACSYSPVDTTMVINANAYRAFVLAESWQRFGGNAYRAAAESNLNFILQAQQADGSWLYALSSQSDHFIDNFHTCLVLKNLVKANRILNRTDIWKAIERGYEYYLRNLLDDDGQPKPFARLGRANLVWREMYDYAEGISLGMLLYNIFPSQYDTSNLRERAHSVAASLASYLIENYQLPAGYFLTKIHLRHVPHTKPYLRWAQAQLFYALTNLLQKQNA